MLSQYSSPVRKRSRLIAIFFALAMTALAVLSGLYYLGTLSLKVDGRLKSGLKHYDGGAKLIAETVVGTGKLGMETNPAERNLIQKSLLSDLDRAAGELGTAGREFRKMKSVSNFKWEKDTAKLMIKSANELDEAIKELSSALAESGEINKTLSLIREAAQHFRQAAGESNKLVLMNNSGRYSQVKAEAPAVASGFAKARSLIEEVKNTRPEAALDQFLTPVISGEKLMANLTLMADYAASGRSEDYDRLNNESNGLINQLIATDKSPMFINPDQWIKENLNDDINTVKKSVENAKKLREKALDLWQDKT